MLFFCDFGKSRVVQGAACRCPSCKNSMGNILGNEKCQKDRILTGLGCINSVRRFTQFYAAKKRVCEIRTKALKNKQNLHFHAKTAFVFSQSPK